MADTDGEQVEVRVRKAVGAKIRQTRTARGWSRARMVDALNQSSGLITTSKYLSKWEAGDRKPGYVWGPVIERVLDLDLRAIKEGVRAQLGVADEVLADAALAQVVAEVEARLARLSVGDESDAPPAVSSRPELKADGYVLLPVVVNGRPVLIPVNAGGLRDLLPVPGGCSRPRGLFALPALIGRS